MVGLPVFRSWLRRNNVATYPGLMYLCMDDMLALRSLVDILRVPSLDLRVRYIPESRTPLSPHILRLKGNHSGDLF